MKIPPSLPQIPALGMVSKLKIIIILTAAFLPFQTTVLVSSKLSTSAVIQVFLRASCHHTLRSTSKSQFALRLHEWARNVQCLVPVTFTQQYELPKAEHNVPLVSNKIQNFLAAGIK